MWHPSVRLSRSVQSSSVLPMFTWAPVSSSVALPHHRLSPSSVALTLAVCPICDRSSIATSFLGTCGLFVIFGMSIKLIELARSLLSARDLIKGVKAPLNPVSFCAKVLVTLVQLRTASNSHACFQSSPVNAHPGLNCISYCRRPRFNLISERRRPCTAAIRVVL